MENVQAQRAGAHRQSIEFAESLGIRRELRWPVDDWITFLRSFAKGTARSAISGLRLIWPARPAANTRLDRTDAGKTGLTVSRTFRSLRYAFVSVGLISILINLLMLTGPLFMLQIYDRVLASGSVPTLIVIGSLALQLYLFMGLFETIRGRMLARIGQSADAQLTGLAYSLSTELPLGGATSKSNQRPVQDLDAVRQFLSGPGPAAIFDIPWMPFYLAIVFLFHGLLGTVALIGAIAICILAGLNEVFSRQPANEAAAIFGQRQRTVEVSRRNAEAVKAMGMMNALSSHWNAENGNFLEKQRKASDRAGFFTAAIKTIRFVLQSAILAVGAWLAINQEISAGVMIAASIMTSRALAPVEQAVGNWRGFVAARTSLHRLSEVIGSATGPQRQVTLPLPVNTVHLEDIYCAPGGILKPVVQGVSFDLQAGDGLGIIGPSGSGKSTLARSIVGVTPLVRGTVRFDNAELTQWSPERIGRIIGYLPQDVQLFDGSIAQNIARFNPDVPSDAIIEAAGLADVHELIVGMPDGYETVIGSAGLTLSAGQSQRIALARALYGNPFLIVLDEPNSNLDTEGERALTDAIKAMRTRGSIVIVIAHRPSAISVVDKILCLKEGRVAGFGPKSEIMKKVIRPVPNVGAA